MNGREAFAKAWFAAKGTALIRKARGLDFETEGRDFAVEVKGPGSGPSMEQLLEMGARYQKGRRSALVWVTRDDGGSVYLFDLVEVVSPLIEMPDTPLPAPVNVAAPAPRPLWDKQRR